MQTINEKSHYATVISSLKKQYVNTKIGKVLNPNDIYILDVVYKFLDECCLPLTDCEKKDLLDIYKKLLYKSNTICTSNYQDKYQVSKKNKTIQAEKTDCNNFNTPVYSYYWQENSVSKTQTQILAEILNDSYFTNKSKTSIAKFNEGIEIPYNNVGRISFYIGESKTLNYEIRDIDNLVITDSFDIKLEPNTGGTLITSKNIYSYGQIFFKIKKL